MRRRVVRGVWIALGLVGLALILPGRVSVWVDESGHTWLTDGTRQPPPNATRVSPADLSLQWGGDVLGEPLERGSSSSREEDRYLRAVFAARSDVLHGDVQRGLRSLRRLQREHPRRPEAAFLLALVERRRARLEPAREALESALAGRDELPPAWRQAAEQLLREVDEELRFARESGAREWRTDSLDSADFHIAYDHKFAGRQYGGRVLAMLKQVRVRVQQVLGRTLAEPLEVRLYTRAHYLEQYKHRFGFATVGFYDGAIHVVSARHPREELYALLIHEYVHALFEDALGSHTPFFLNEGIAEREESTARGRARLARGEWRRLLDAVREDGWIPYDSIVVGFGGLEGRRALLAYLESRAAIEVIEDQHPGAIARWLGRCAAGEPWEPALLAETGWDTQALETTVQDEVVARFPPDPLRSGTARAVGAH